ncbi:hypothetical protein [Maritimibacter sp. 55A14]|uniref:hypothetical protein n=1 Tax=Maritimibacter sp. 55A14 TaxID=2174844 RepID=UPI0011B22B43|nr:hypothetical protein [Maritimibacter sp. 55A14]
MSIHACVADYIDRCRTKAREEILFFSSQPNLSDAIMMAANCRRADGKRHPHQRRIPNRVLGEAERQLLANSESISAAQDFDALLVVVNHTIRSIRGIGELTVYDTAHRIGAFLGLAPEKVYLHAGARTGAAGLGFSGKMIEKDQLPAAFAPLTAAEIEDCLCIYKDKLCGVGLGSSVCAGRVRISACSPNPRHRRRAC